MVGSSATRYISDGQVLDRCYRYHQACGKPDSPLVLDDVLRPDTPLVPDESRVLDKFCFGFLFLFFEVLFDGSHLIE